MQLKIISLTASTLTASFAEQFALMRREQAAKDAEKKFIKSDTEKKSSLLNSWRRYQGTHPMLDPDRMTLRNAARAAFTAADTSAASLAAGTARRVLDEAEAKRRKAAHEVEIKKATKKQKKKRVRNFFLHFRRRFDDDVF